MTKVKICGITTERDTEILNRYLPDYAGFLFAKSRRQVTPEAAGRLAARLDASIGKVGVFVNGTREEIVRTVAKAGLDVVQLHGDETPGNIRSLRRLLDPGVEIWKAVRVKDKTSVEGLGNFAADRYLLDAYVEGSYGGAGKSFEWVYAKGAAAQGSIVLAGGLDASNVARAIRMVGPYAVDVSSGVESGGCKDEAKVRDFIIAAREAEVCKDE